MKTLSTLFLIGGVAIFLFIFGPVVKEELRYQFDQWAKIQYSLEALPEFPESGIRLIIPVDKGFGIVIPKININAPIYPDVDPNDPAEYLPILREGVAHTKGSAFPGKEGNIFLFAHSSDAFYNLSTARITSFAYNVGRYNAIFYLIGKLEKGDEVDVFYKNKRYQYEVIEKKIILSEEIEYWKAPTTGKTVTLMTGYPPGTTLKRLIVIARQKT